MEPPKVTVRREAGGVCVVVCAGEFDMDHDEKVAAACAGEAADAARLVLDVARVTFADSSFLSLLVRLRNTRDLVLQGPVPGQLHRLLEMTGALDLFEIRTAGPQAGEPATGSAA